MACCLPTCAQGLPVSVTEFVGHGAVCVFLGRLGDLFILGVLALLGCLLVCVGPESRRRALRWTRPLGGGRRGHCLRGSLGVHQITGK